MNRRAEGDASEWKRGLPRGKYYEGMVRDYEVYFSPGGVKWHRRRTEDQLKDYDMLKECNRDR